MIASPDQTDILRENYPSAVTLSATSRFYAYQAYIFYHKVCKNASFFHCKKHRTFRNFIALNYTLCIILAQNRHKKPQINAFPRNQAPHLSIFLYFFRIRRLVFSKNCFNVPFHPPNSAPNCIFFLFMEILSRFDFFGSFQNQTHASGSSSARVCECI